ncbi:MAG: flavodoxin [Faecalibacterium sp.]
MKKLLDYLSIFLLLVMLTACTSQSAMIGAASDRFSESSVPSKTEPESALPPEDSGKTLIVYFSATGNTKAVAEKIADLTGAELYEIVPAEPYTAEDLDYNNEDCRANREMNDASARPAIGSETLDLSSYDTIFIGYPIWWGTMPRIIHTFLDAYDLSGKTVLPFCTSGSSGISRSVSDIRAAEPNADVRDGLRASGANDSGIESWIVDNGIS